MEVSAAVFESRDLSALVYRHLPLRDLVLRCRNVSMLWRRNVDAFMARSRPRRVSVAFCGHVDSGKSTAAGHLIYLMGGYAERERLRLLEEANRLGKGTFSYAYYFNTLVQERERGISVESHSREMVSDTTLYEVRNVPGHGCFMRNMYRGASQSDVIVLMMPANGQFAVALARGDARSIMGGTRLHATLSQVLGIKQAVVCVTMMDAAEVQWSEQRFAEVVAEAGAMLLRAGFSKSMVDATPVLPVSALLGDNLCTPSANMPWWKGTDVATKHRGTVHVTTLLDALEATAPQPYAAADKPLCMPVLAVQRKRGVGLIVIGRLRQGLLRRGMQVEFVPTPQAGPCIATVASIGTFDRRVDEACAGCSVGVLLAGCQSDNEPRAGHIMVLHLPRAAEMGSPAPALSAEGAWFQPVHSFVVQIKVTWLPVHIRRGYEALALVSHQHARVRVASIAWRAHSFQPHQKEPNPAFVSAQDFALLTVTVLQPLVVTPFAVNEHFGRLVLQGGAPFGHSVVAYGKIEEVLQAETKQRH